jgi:hypothetical protein
MVKGLEHGGLDPRLVEPPLLTPRVEGREKLVAPSGTLRL